jgi:hypothetical protein
VRGRTSWLRSAWGILAKDLAIEWHSREIVYTMGFLATLVVLIFSFALVAGQDARMEPPATLSTPSVFLIFGGQRQERRTCHGLATCRNSPAGYRRA